MSDERQEEAVEFVGPFESHDVKVYGRCLPLLQAFPRDDGNVLLMLDRRLGLDLTLLEAQRFVPFLADCMAVAMGYASFPQEAGEPVPRPPFPHLTSLVQMETEDVDSEPSS